MRPATRELGLVLALIGLAGVLYFQRGENAQLREAERAAVNAYRGARAQTDDAFRLVGGLRDSLRLAGSRVDTVVRELAGTADTIRLRASVPGDSVTISKFEMLAWADKIDLAVNEVSQYRVQVDSLLVNTHVLTLRLAEERATADSLLALKDLRITAERKQGRKEGAVLGFLAVAAGVLIFK